MKSPLSSLKVIEFAGLGPTPYSAMVLADFGAKVLRLERPNSEKSSFGNPLFNYLNRGRSSIEVDLKTPEGLALAKDLCNKADILVEGFRPGVMERLGLGPKQLMEDNPRLIYARMTGWGQTGPFAKVAGHDINYLAMTGGLHLLGVPGHPPTPPVNLVGDYGGGAMFNIMGILSAVIERSQSGLGQVIDTSMLDGSSMLLTQIFAWKQMGHWHPERGGNLLDGGAYFYRCYETLDNKYMAVGALEREFHDELVVRIGLNPDEFRNHLDRSTWAERAERFATMFKSRSQQEWCDILLPYDTCATPVLTLAEAVDHPVNRERNVFQKGQDGGIQPTPAPRLSRTPGTIGTPPQLAGKDGAEQLAEWGIDEARVSALRMKGHLKAD